MNLAIAEKELGLPIPDEAIEQMRAHLKLDEEQMRLAAEEEKRRRHDVMAHVHVFGLMAPAAAPFIQYVRESNSHLSFTYTPVSVPRPAM